MKESGQKVILVVHGRERTFSEEELTAIVEKFVPTEGQWFQVKPLDIDQRLFEEERKDRSQEETRQLMLEAFAELNNNPEKYGKNFKTMMPKKDWSLKNVPQLKEKACELGDHMADWVEQALEWAQRIANGESWKAICNDGDIANWYRAVVWKKGYTRQVGGMASLNVNTLYPYPASSVFSTDYYDTASFSDAVPLVVAYDD